MKDKYKNINVLLNINNIEIQQEKIKNVILLLEKQYEFDLDFSKWKCSTRDILIQKVVYLKDLLLRINKKMDYAKRTLNMIEKIQEISRQIKRLEQENEMLKNSINPNDKLKILQNNDIIESNREYIEQLENDITTLGW